MSNEENGWVPPGPSRKAPCPCGSGRKYKKCCLQKRESEAFPVLWPKLNATLRELSQTLQEFASDTWGPRYVEHAWDDFWGGDAPVDVGTGPFSSLFATWYLFHWAPGKAIVLESEPLPLEDTIAAEYLREHGEGLEPLSRQYLETARLTPISFWQVESVVRERGLQMKDLATGKELFVNEVQATRHAAIWDLMLCKVISVDGTNVIDGAGPYVMPASAKPMVRE
ncbi:MAG: SEC-C domain-containing protein, partial [Candidatus Riflebacteria bacterium]|nr:SEC-C domain-containing protein [Candidatus Riflebacteria bacterium]